MAGARSSTRIAFRRLLRIATTLPLILLCICAQAAQSPQTAPVTRDPQQSKRGANRPQGEGGQRRVRNQDGPTTPSREAESRPEGKKPDSDAARSFKDEDGLVPINLREAKIDQIVKFISDNTGKAVILQPGLEGTINIIAPQPLPVKEALNLVYESLLLHKIVVIESDKRIAIVNTEKAPVIPLPLETDKAADGSTMVMKLITLQHMNAESAVSFLSPLFPDKEALKSVPQAGAVLVKGTRQEIARIETMLKEVDRPDAARLEIKIFPLKNAEASAVANQLQTLMNVVFEDAGGRRQGGDGQQQQQGGSEGQRRSDQARMRILGDEANRRIVAAGTPAILSYMADVIEQLDQSDTAKLQINEVELLHADPQSVANLVTQVYRDLGSNENERRAVRAFAQGRMVFVVSSKDKFEEVRDLLKRLDSAEPVMQLRVHPLKHAEAEQVSRIVQDLLRSGAFTVQPAASQPASMPAASQPTSAPTDRMQDFEERVRLMREQLNSQSPSGPSEMRSFIMERMGGRSGGRGNQPQPTVAADERMNSLVVLAYPEQQAELTRMLQQIDVPEPGDLAIRVIEISSGEAEQVVRSVQNLYQSMARGRGSRSAVQLSASPDEKKLIVLSTEEDFKRVQEIVNQLQGGTNIKLHTVSVNFSDVALLAEMVEEVNSTMNKTTSTVSVTPHLNGKSLLVMASSEDFAVIEGVIKELDNKQSITLRVFELQNADSEDLATVIESAVEAGYATEGGSSVRRPTGPQGQGQRRRQQGEAGVQVYPDRRTNTLVVVGTPEDIAVVADLVTKMDKAVPQDLSVRNIDLNYTRASEIQSALQRVFQRLPRQSDRDVVEITATRDEKRLIVLSSEENYKKILELLKELDSREEAELTVIALQYADASDLASVLGNMLRSAKSGTTGRGTGQNAVYTVYGESGGLFTTKSDVTIIAETRINALLIAAAPEDLKVIQDLVEKLDRPREEQLSMHIMKLNYADASSVADAASQFFQTKSRSPRDEVKILANVYDNSIMVFASEENWLRIQQFVKEMDVSDVGKRGTKTYELKYIDASRLAAQLEELYSEQQPASYWDYVFGPAPRRQSQTKVNFVASPIGNRLMVVAPPQEISKIDELVAQLDSPQALEGIRPRIYYIRHTDASQMREILTDLFEGADGSAQNRNMFDFYRPNRPQNTANESLGDVSFVVDRDANALIAFSSNPANLDLVDDLINQLDILAPESTNTETIQLEYADAYNMAILLNSLYGGTQPRQQGNQPQQQQRQPQGNDSEYSTLSPVRTLEQKPEYGDLYFWWQSSNDRQNQEARPISTLIEQVRIVPDLRTNSLLLTAAPHHLEPLKALIAYLDRPEPQVVIKTRIVEIIKRGEKRVGVRWTPDPAQIRPEELDNAVTALGSLNLIETFGAPLQNTNFRTGPSINNNTVTRDFGDAGQHIVGADINLSLLIQLLLKNSDSRELSKPTLTVDNNETGTIFVGADVPFITNSQINTNGARNDSYEYREVGTRLDITPHINSKGQVVLEIDLGSSNIREGQSLFGGAILDRRTYSTQIALEDGQTLVLGGILGQNERDTLRKAPVLGDIPVLGKAFRKTERVDETTELVAFVTPQVLWNREDADHATNQMIAQTDPENRDFYPTVAAPTAEQHQEMLQLDQRRKEAAAAREVDRMRSWEYSVSKIRNGPDQLNRAYEVLKYDNQGYPQPASQPVMYERPPAEKTDAGDPAKERVAPGVWKVETASEPQQPSTDSSANDVMRARLSDLLHEVQQKQAIQPQAAAPGAVLEMLEAVEAGKTQ